MFWNGNHRLATGMNQEPTCHPGERRSVRRGTAAANRCCQAIQSTPVMAISTAGPNAEVRAEPAVQVER